MGERIEQRLVLVLPVQLNKTSREIAQRARGGQGAVYEGSASPLRSDVAADDELTTVSGFEDGFDRRLSFAGSDEIQGCPRAQQQSDRLDEDGFARSGLARQNVEAGLELDVNGLDDSEVADTEETQHARGTSIVS